jgi:hypothetical protein
MVRKNKHRSGAAGSFAQERKEHIALVAELKILLRKEESPFSKFLIQQNIIYYQTLEMIWLATSIMLHASSIGMLAAGEESFDKHFQIKIGIKDKTTLGALIGTLVSVSAREDIELIQELQKYNTFRNNLVHKIAEQGTYKNIDEITTEAENAVLLGAQIISKFENRHKESRTQILKLTKALDTALNSKDGGSRSFIDIFSA